MIIQIQSEHSAFISVLGKASPSFSLETSAVSEKYHIQQHLISSQEKQSSLPDSSPQPQAPKRIFGCAKNLIKMREDFSEPLEDFQEYM